jgi:DNA (cytosine-5)-methyltransferase 1
MNKFTFVDLFSGIGGFRYVAESFGGVCVFSSEWDPDAQSTYESNFGEKPHGDITKIQEQDIPSHDVLCAGFPCQAFSISGKQRGFEDSRGTLFYDVARIIKKHKPKVLFLENVKNILRHDDGRTISIIRRILDELGYDINVKILKASDFGIPQARERAYFVCFRKDLSIKFEFPIGAKNPVYLIDFMDKHYVSSRKIKYTPVYKDGVNLDRLNELMLAKPIQIGMVHYGGQGDRIYSPYGHAVTLSAHGGGTFSKTGGYFINGHNRKLTPRECANVMGFPEDFKIHKKDNKAYEQFGNSVVIPVVNAIFENIKKTEVLKYQVKQEV